MRDYKFEDIEPISTNHYTGCFFEHGFEVLVFRKGKGNSHDKHEDLCTMPLCYKCQEAAQECIPDTIRTIKHNRMNRGDHQHSKSAGIVQGCNSFHKILYI